MALLAFSTATLLTASIPRPTQDNMERLNIEAKASFARFELVPFPKVRVFTKPGRLKANELSRSVLYEDGSEEIWVKLEFLGLADMEDALDHESAHLRTWRDYGPHVAEHGTEWMRTCRAHAKNPRALCTKWYD